jgi:ribosomal protein S18 acetylase RimI-like enzyme
MANPLEHRGAIVVRTARADEREVIARITRAAYVEYASSMAPEAWPELAAAIESGLASTAPVERIVAELDGCVVGSAMLFAANVEAYAHVAGAQQVTWPEVRLVAVDASARGRGIARAMMEECVRRARAAGARAIGIHTSQTMGAAVALYRSMGFERVPALDFQPAGAELVEAYRLAID